MIYSDLCGNSVSALGMGMMRLPLTSPKDSDIDEPQVQQMVDLAIERGVNYFDTAWGYHDGNSQVLAGRCLTRHDRDSYYIANKFPGYDVGNFGKAEEIFEKQLRKAGLERFDYYLLHNVCELNIEQYLDDAKYGTASYFIEQRKAGRIGHLGFSVHGNIDTLRRFLAAYGDDMEFCQMQVNWFDWGFQGVEAKLSLCKERSLPIIAMEPVRGGALVNLKPQYTSRLEALRSGMPPVEWALRYLQCIPQVALTLTGASSLEQLRQNIDIFETREALGEEDLNALGDIAREMASGFGVPCTACRYCTSHCPKELDIPWLLELYNEHKSTEGKVSFLAPMAIAALPPEKKPQACIGCGSCSAVCPQQIDIPAALEDFAGMLS